MPAYNGSTAADRGGLIYLVYGGDDEDHRAFALYLGVDSDCRDGVLDPGCFPRTSKCSPVAFSA